jgi:hypothetical protein
MHRRCRSQPPTGVAGYVFQIVVNVTATLARAEARQAVGSSRSVAVCSGVHPLRTTPGRILAPTMMVGIG